MKFKQLIKILDSSYSDPNVEDFQVRGISCNSKNAQDGFIFVAISGTREDGHRFIEEAISKGAKAVIVHSSWFMVHSLKKIPVIAVEDTRKALAKIAAEFYGRPSSKIKVVGVTGTNGKTTITYLIEAILKEAGSSPAVIGTVNYRFKDKIIVSSNTTPGPLELESLLADMSKAGCDYALAEVSSHALDQDRTDGINFSSAIFTNLTQDHLDYHHSLEEYFQAKAKLFKDMDAGVFVAVNNDDAYGRRIAGLTKAKVITYGIDNPADITAKDIKFGIADTQFLIVGSEKELAVKSRLIGRHNVYNILAAIAWSLKEGIEPKVIKSAVEKFILVPGRLERIDSGGDFAVFIDYAHTEDALSNVIRSLRQLSRNKIIVVFGCGGDRDKTKRPKMGYVVTELADYAIITDDNPRSEDPQAIIEDIKRGIKKENFCVIPERLRAIRKSLQMAGPGDIVLIAGKGHEDCQIINNRREHFDDREAARECLKSLNY